MEFLLFPRCTISEHITLELASQQLEQPLAAVSLFKADNSHGGARRIKQVLL